VQSKGYNLMIKTLRIFMFIMKKIIVLLDYTRNVAAKGLNVLDYDAGNATIEISDYQSIYSLIYCPGK
jgi:hypothetical protein